MFLYSYHIYSQILDNAYANSHWVGTASMGDDPSHVVDAELRVNGVKNLRVAGTLGFQLL